MEYTESDEELDSEMPWFSKGKKDATTEINYKAKLEHKLLLAKQDPEPVFDLTECNLHNVPSGVYSWCKVCRKEILLLQNNKLKSLNGGGHFKDLTLLRVLDLHSNKLSQVPNDVGMLTNLQALYLHFNQLKNLPDTIDRLTNLKVLSLKGNDFKAFPEPVCSLQSLSKLDISGNSLKYLPNSLHRLKSLTTLVLDADNYEHPPKDACKKGLESIMRHLCQESGVEYHPPKVEAECLLSLESATNYSTLVDNWSKIAQTQDSQQQARIQVEKSLQSLYESLTKLTFSAHQQKQQFFQNLMQNQEKLDVELSTAQQRKDVDRQKLLLELCEVEKESNETIEELLEMSSMQRNTEALLEELEKERKEFYEMFISVKSDSLNLCRKEVLEVMEQVLENQYREYQMNMTNTLGRKELVENAHSEGLELDRKLFEIKTQSSLDQKALIAKLLEEEEYQKKAFVTLLMKKDGEYGRLTEQIMLVENELTNLTLLEVKKQDLKVNFEKSVLEEQREVFTKLLIQLMAQKDIRRKEFEKRLVEMEARRSQEQVDFWLLQCQRLMDCKPEILKQKEKYLNAYVKATLKRAEATQYLPKFAQSNITMEELTAMGDEDLRELGIGEAGMREAILREAQADGSSTAEATISPPPTPTAPPLASLRQKSLRARFETECVVCMEQMCSLLFLNCGHVCCCEQCGPTLKICPLCRGDIERYMYLRPTLGGVMVE